MQVTSHSINKGLLRGNVIFFQHDGPQVAASSIVDRANWLCSDGHFKVMLAGPDAGTDNLSRWLIGKNVIAARPHVLGQRCIASGRRPA